MESLLLICVTTMVCAQVPAGEATAEPKAIDRKALPANQWVPKKLSGFQAHGFWRGISEGFTCADGLGVVALNYNGPDLGDRTGQLGSARVWKLDLAAGAWSLAASNEVPVDFRMKFNRLRAESMTGLQLCYDSDRRALVGVTTTGLDGKGLPTIVRGKAIQTDLCGQTVEFDLNKKEGSSYLPEPSPPPVTAGSLCYDPVNKEVVLATGGFSPMGGTDGCWLYDGSKHEWRRLEGPKEVEAVRLPLEKLRDRTEKLRWLAWKNLEFRATDREKLLDERSKGEALATEAAALATELKESAALAAKNAPAAGQAYHRQALEMAAGMMAAAAGKFAGAAEALKAGAPEVVEELYRKSLVPAHEEVEKALSELAIHPEPRMSARVVYDPKHKVMVLFGGDRQDGLWGDTWVYHCEGRWWERRHPEVHPPPSTSRSTAFDRASGLTVTVIDAGGGSNKARPQTWAYDAGANQWRLLKITGDDKAGDVFFLEYDGAAGCLVGFNMHLNEACLLRLDSSTAEPFAAKACPEVHLTVTDGDFVLRDAATIGELKKWKADTDEWAAKLPANTWTPLPRNGTGQPNKGRTWSSHVYDPGRRQIYYKGGGHGSYHGAVTDHYDLCTGRWFRSARREEPSWPMGSYFCWGRAFSCAPWAVHTYKYKLYFNPLIRCLQRDAEGYGAHNYDPDTGRWSRGFHPLPTVIGGGSSTHNVVPSVPDGVLAMNKDGTGWHMTAAGTREWKDLGSLPGTWQIHAYCWFYDPHRKLAMYYANTSGGAQLFALDVIAAEPKWKKLDIKPAKKGGRMPLSTREVAYIPRHDVFIMAEANGYMADKNLKPSPELPPAKQNSPLLVLWAIEPKDDGYICRELKIAGPNPGEHYWSQGLSYCDDLDTCIFSWAWSAFRYVPEARTP